MQLEDRKALVTGGGRGIGRSIALAFAAAGADVALLARSREQLDEVAAAVEAYGRQALVLQADLANMVQLRQGIGTVMAAWGRVDVLVNNAGMQGPIGLTHEVDWDAWCQTLQVNLLGTLGCTRLVLPGMIERKKGKIINLSGGGAVGPRPRFGAYSASKAAVVRLTETLADEMRPWNIDVNAIAPGAVSTAMQRQVLEAGEAAGDEGDEARKVLAGGGVPPERAAALAVFLASARSDGLSGRLLSAVWDAWEDLDIAAVMATEAYTVRRLKPEGEEDG